MNPISCYDLARLWTFLSVFFYLVLLNTWFKGSDNSFYWTFILHCIPGCSPVSVFSLFSLKARRGLPDCLQLNIWSLGSSPSCKKSLSGSQQEGVKGRSLPVCPSESASRYPYSPSAFAFLHPPPPCPPWSRNSPLPENRRLVNTVGREVLDVEKIMCQNVSSSKMNARKSNGLFLESLRYLENFHSWKVGYDAHGRVGWPPIKA